MCLIWYQQLILVYHSPIWIRSLVIWHHLQNLHNVHIDRCKIFACFWNPHLLQKLERISHLEQKKIKIRAHFKFSCLSKDLWVYGQNTQIRKVLIWTFWDYKSLWSKKSTPIQPQGVIGAPPTMYFQKMQILGVFRPFLQRSLVWVMSIKLDRPKTIW